MITWSDYLYTVSVVLIIRYCFCNFYFGFNVCQKHVSAYFIIYVNYSTEDEDRLWSPTMIRVHTTCMYVTLIVCMLIFVDKFDFNPSPAEPGEEAN